MKDSVQNELNKKENLGDESEHLKELKINKYLLDDQIESLVNKLENSSLNINRLDYYGNTIPLGAFCFAISFVLFGFSDSGIVDNPNSFAYLAILLFGGLGQITAGILEYIKSRTFPTACYLLYGIYFISFFFGYYFNNVLENNKSRKIFFGTWAGLSFPLVIASLRTNVIYILQNISICAFYVVRCIGECKDWDNLNGLISGILEMITGFLSLYLCFSQILNEHYRCNILPAFPISKENEIDVNVNNKLI